MFKVDNNSTKSKFRVNMKNVFKVNNYSFQICVSISIPLKDIRTPLAI